MHKRTMLVSLLLIAALALGAVVATAQDEMRPSPVLQDIVDRGELICGGNANLAGFGVVNEAGEYEGFDIDICRAVAVAVLGDANAMSVRPLVAADRQAAIQNGEIDMMSRNTTWTVSRDITWNAIFGPTTFYDGQGIGVRAEDGFTSLSDIDGGTICVQSGTTTELNITDAVAAGGLDIAIETFPDAPSTWEAFASGGRCDAWTTDKSGILSYHASSADPGQYAILDDTLSKEPLGPLSPESDPRFAELIAWTVFGMLEAEEQGITSENVDEFLESDNPVIQRLLGIGENVSGDYFDVVAADGTVLVDIENDFMVEVIRQVGNYGEVFERNLGVAPFNLQRGLNDLWTNGGLMYAPPFR